MGHYNGVTTRVNGRIVNIPSRGLKDPHKNEVDAVKREEVRLKAGGKLRAAHKSYKAGAEASKKASRKMNPKSPTTWLPFET